MALYEIFRHNPGLSQNEYLPYRQALYLFEQSVRQFAKPPCHETTLELDGKNPQHIGVLNAFAAAILRGEPLVADGVEGIHGLELSNAMHLSSWLEKPGSLPIDEDLFLEKLNEHRANSKKKENVQDITFDTTGSYGSKTKE